MSDDFLSEARGNWRGLDAEVAGLAARMRRQRMQSRLSAALSIAGSAVAIVAGAWLLLGGLDGAYSLLGRVTGLLLLFAIPVLAASSWAVRKHSPRWEAETPEGILRDALKHLDVRARLLGVLLWHAYALGVFSVILWTGAALGLMPFDRIIIFFSLFYPLTAAATLYWVRLRRAAIARERARCEALLAEYQ